MGRKAKVVTVSSKRPLSSITYSNKCVVICASLIIATLAYALYQPFSIGAHLHWIYGQSLTPIEVERYVMNNSISYR